MQNSLGGAPPKWNRSDLPPVIKAHPGPDPRDERKERGSGGVGEGVLQLPALHMKHTFLHLIPMKSHRRMLLQRQRSVCVCGRRK